MYGLLCVAAVLSVLYIKEASARINFNINLNVGPPVMAVAEPPEVVLIPGSDVYFVPQGDIDVFFYDGYWWCPRGRHWYRASAYNGPWESIRRGTVPIQVSRVPLKTYRNTYSREQHIPYGQFNNQWQSRHGNMQGNRPGVNRQGTNMQRNRPGVNMQNNRQGTNMQRNKPGANMQNRQGTNMQENKPGVNRQGNKPGTNMQNNKPGSNMQENKQGNRQDNSGGR